MGKPYEYTRLEVRQIDAGELIVTISLMRADGSHKYPQMVQKPWRHYFTCPSDVTVESLFWQVRDLLLSHGVVPPGAPAPPEGATGGRPDPRSSV